MGCESLKRHLAVLVVSVTQRPLGSSWGDAVLAVCHGAEDGQPLLVYLGFSVFMDMNVKYINI